MSSVSARTESSCCLATSTTGIYTGHFFRSVDGSPAVRLGDGNPMDLSPDGKYALSSLSMDLSQIELLPTGTGESRQLTHEKVDFLSARWLDNTRILASGNEAGHPVRVYVIDLEGHVKAVTPEGMLGVAVSGADGKKLLVQKRENGKRELMILPLVDGGGVNIGWGRGRLGRSWGTRRRRWSSRRMGRESTWRK